MTEEEKAILREYIDEKFSDEWNDDRLTVFYTAAEGDLRLAAASIWRVKAAKYSKLVNVSENGSSRALGDLYKNALEMAGQYGGGEDGGSYIYAPTTRAIVRP